jgi:protein-disulfide isomerase-like protein with CxxC motif
MPNFAVDIGDAGVAVERNIAAAPSSLGVVGQGLSNLASNMFGVYDAGVRAAKAAEPTQTELDRSVMASFYDALEAGRGGSTAERNAAASNGIAILQRSGLGLGQNETDAIRRTLGIDINIIDPMQAAANSALVELNNNPAYILKAEQDLTRAFAAEGRTPTQEEIVGYAFNLLAEDKANTLTISNGQNQSRAEWISTGQPAAERLITSLTDQALIGLKIEASGGNVSVDSIMQLEAGYAQLKAVLARPANVTAEDYASTQAQLSALEELITTVKSYDATQLDLQGAEMLEAISGMLLAQAKETGDATSAITAIALLSPEGRTQFFTSQAANIWTTLSRSNPEILAAIADTSTGSTTDTIDLTEFNSLMSGKKPVSDLPNTTANSSEVIDKVSGLSVEDQADLVQINNAMVVGAVSTAGLNDPQAREAFVSKAQEINASFATSTELFDPLTLEGVYTPDYFSKLNALKALGDPSYEVLYAQTKEAIMKQWAVFSQTYANTLAAGVFNFDAAGNLLLEEENNMLSSQEVGFINRAAGQYYNGSILSMFSDMGRRLSNEEPRTYQLVIKLRPQFDAVYGYVNGAKSYRRLARRAGLTDNTMENILKAVRQRTTTRQPVTMENLQQQGAETFSGAGTTIPAQPVDAEAATAEISQYLRNTIIDPDWSANPEEVYNAIPSGTRYRDPSGNIRTKG